VFALLSTIAIVLSAAGLWALMSFTVSQRTREIGIRTALGAQPDRIMRVIARRAAIQIGAGVILGAFVGGALITELRGEDMARDTPWPIVLGIVASIMIAVGFVACAGPTRRGLRIQPIQALREGA